MTMRPEDIKNRTFANALRGYDKDEVRSFLFRVAESSRELHEQLTATEAELASALVVESDDELAAEGPAEEGAEVLADEWGAAEPALPEVEAGVFDAAFALPTSDDSVTEFPTPAAEFAEDFTDPAPAVEFAAPAVEETPAPAAFVEAPTESLAAAEQSIADRYGAIGDRIADLLRNADESAAELRAGAETQAAATRAEAEAAAEQTRFEAEERASQLLAEAQSIRTEADAYRDEVMAELANARIDQEAALQDARSSAEAEVETFRVDSINEITGLRSDAFVEIDELRLGANNEVAELRTTAQAEAETMRESVLAEATASIADDEAEATRLREEAELDRAAARSELDEVRTEVSSLLEQARSQSEFIKQEADEIIRTKVRSNFEQAQTRIDVLRNTEVASRERIVLAQTELASALTRLDAEPLPELDPNDSPAVIDEAVARHEGLAAGEPETPVIDAAEVDADVIGTDVVDADVIDTDVVDTAIVDTAAVDAMPAEEGSLSSFFGPGATDESETTGDMLTGSPDAAFDADTQDATDTFDGGSFDGGWATTEVSDVDYESSELEGQEGADSGFETSEFVAEADESFGGFEVTEHVVVESAEYGDLPVRGVTPPGDELPVRNPTAPQPDAFSAPETFGAASLAEAIPTESDDEELGGAAQEDALARLVREAMQEAVDSARKND